MTNKTIEERERERMVMVAENHRVAKPILEELAALGYRVSSFFELRRSGRYESALPVLISWLPRLENRHILMDVVRSLSVPYAKPMAQRPLIEAYHRASDETVKWTIGNGLEVLADRNILEDLIEIATDRRHGKAREMVVLGLGRVVEPRSTATLIALLDDPDVAGHAVAALRKHKVPEARPHLERFLTHPMPWIRKEAKSGIAALDKKLAEAKAK